MPKHDCYDPRYHSESINMVGAAILMLLFVQKNCTKNPSIPWCRIPTRIAPLCEFGGVTWKNDDHSESAGFTYAVCPDCFTVYSSGWNDKGINPKKCKCDTEFSNKDYFQPVYSKSPDPENDFFPVVYI